jgi:hypothetical protein
MRGFTTVCIIVQLGSALNFKEKIYGLALLNSQMDEKRRKQKWKITQKILSRQQWKQITNSRVLSGGNIITVV